MGRSCCRRVLDALCPCFRQNRLGSSPSVSGASGEHDMSLNFILHGECGVGKTSLRNRWVDGIFTGDVAPTFGVDFNIKTLDLVQEEGEDEGDPTREEEPAVAGKTLPSGGRGKGGSKTKQAPCADLQVKINVYDTSGKPGYREVNSTYLLAFDAVLFVYDISSVSTLNELRRYFSDPEHRDKLAAKKKAGMAMLLVGNKCDMPLSQRQQVGSQTGQDTAAEFGMPFVEVSAKTGTNVREAFMFATTRAVGEHLARTRLKQSAGRGRGATVKKTMQKVPGLQRALRTRASVLDVFKGLTGRRRYPQKAQPVIVLPPSPPIAGNTPTAATTSASGGGGGGGGSAEERPLQRLPSSARRGGRGGLGQGTTARAWALRAAAPPHRRHLSKAKSSSPRGLATASAAAAAAASQGLQQRRPESPVARSGTGDAATSSLLERPELSPVEVERGSEGTAFRKIGASTVATTTAAEDKESVLACGRRSSGTSPERTVSNGGGGRGSVSQGAAAAAAATAEESATKQLREASSFWLDKWGIKAAKTDATRERHSKEFRDSYP
ncbi:unnamed protein product [Ectocarpus sp. 6 AP-2014]